MKLSNLTMPTFFVVLLSATQRYSALLLAARQLRRAQQ
jgi:hypothetical protein